MLSSGLSSLQLYCRSFFYHLFSCIINAFIFISLKSHSTFLDSCRTSSQSFSCWRWFGKTVRSHLLIIINEYSSLPSHDCELQMVNSGESYNVIYLLHFHRALAWAFPWWLQVLWGELWLHGRQAPDVLHSDQHWCFKTLVQVHFSNYHGILWWWPWYVLSLPVSATWHFLQWICIF